MREPIKEIFAASKLLSKAADAHLAGNWSEAEDPIRESDKPEVRAWTESLWGSKKTNPNQESYHRYRAVPDAPKVFLKAEIKFRRMPASAVQREVIERDGRHCMFCGIPLIHPKVRNFLRTQYPNALPWGRTNLTQHAAFQCMWLQFDHVLPHRRGGDSSANNVVLTCAPCNFGRMENTLAEFGLLDPRLHPRGHSDWDGLERVHSRRKS